MHATSSRPCRAVPSLVLAIAIALSACGGDSATALGGIRTVTDSIGDTVAVRTLGSSSSGLLTLVEDVRIGELEGADEYMFGQISEVVALPNGNVLAFDQQAVALREYGADGRVVRTIGRRGAGPGEYQATNGATVLADGRIALWDPRNGRIEIFGTDSAAPAQILVPSGFFSMRSLWSDGAGTLIYRANILPRPDETDNFPGARPGVVRLAVDGTRADTVLAPVQVDRSMYLSATSPNGSSSMTAVVPFYGAPTWTVHRGGFAYTRDGEYRIVLDGPDGPMIIERDIEPVPVQGAERDNHREFSTANMRRVDPGWTWNGPAIPDYKRPVKTLFSDRDGRLWVWVSMPGMIDSSMVNAPPSPGMPDDMPPLIWTEPAAVDVFEPDGRFVGRIELPPRVSPYMLSGSGDHLWGVQSDELGVHQLVRWRIEGGEG